MNLGSDFRVAPKGGRSSSPALNYEALPVELLLAFAGAACLSALWPCWLSSMARRASLLIEQHCRPLASPFLVWGESRMWRACRLATGARAPIAQRSHEIRDAVPSGHGTAHIEIGTSLSASGYCETGG